MGWILDDFTNFSWKSTLTYDMTKSVASWMN